jgi:hypothetical protein
MIAWFKEWRLQRQLNRETRAVHRDRMAAIKAIDKFMAANWVEPDAKNSSGYYKVRYWKLGAATLRHERYIRGDVVTLMKGQLELACWVDQTHAYKGLGPGKGDFSFHPKFTHVYLQSLLEQYED